MTSIGSGDPTIGNGDVRLEDRVAEALAQVDSTAGRPNRAEAVTSQATKSQEGSDPLMERLARDLTSVFLTTLCEWQTSDGAQALRTMVRHHEHWLTATAERVSELSHNLKSLTETVAHQQAAGAATHKAVGDLREQIQEVTGSIKERVEALVVRVGLQMEDLKSWQTSASDLPKKVDSVVERLDRQAEAIRTLWDSKSQTAHVLEELVGILGRITAGPPTVRGPMDL